MSWIKVIQESEAEGELKEAYARMHEINEVSDRAAERAMQAREHAAATAQAKGLALPMVIWGVTEQAKQAKEKASGR